MTNDLLRAKDDELAALKADIDEGLKDILAGRVRDFDATRIIERGKKLLADRRLTIGNLLSR